VKAPAAFAEGVGLGDDEERSASADGVEDAFGEGAELGRWFWGAGGGLGFEACGVAGVLGGGGAGGDAGGDDCGVGLSWHEV
jgi:hypothetical protein